MRYFAILLSLFALAAGLCVPATASADEIKMVGVITKIDIAGPDAKTATVALKDTKTDQPVTVIVNDAETLDKFKDKRIVPGDEIRLRYETIDGKNVIKSFRKTAGC